MSLIDDAATVERVTADVTDVAPAAGDALEGWVRDLRSDLAAEPPDWTESGDAEPVDALLPQRGAPARVPGVHRAGRHRKAE